MQSYVEQATGLRFRSLLAVERYLKEQEENEDAVPLKEFKRPNRHDVGSILKQLSKSYLIPFQSLTSPVLLQFQLSCRSGSRSPNVSGNKCSPKVASQCPTNSEEIMTMPKEVTPDCDPTVCLSIL